jgi:hemoglobin
MIEAMTLPMPIQSARPEMIAELMAHTGLSEAQLAELVQRFYAKVRADELLGPVFADRITDWEAHLDRMVDFWSSVALMTGRYHGAPVPKHASLPVGWPHFERWLDLFRQTAHETCTPEGAAHVIERAERIAQSLHLAAQTAARGERTDTPELR